MVWRTSCHGDTEERDLCGRQWVVQMNVEEMKQRLKGPIVYVTTPFREVGEYPVDEDAFRRQFRFLIDNRIDLAKPCGGTGEFFSLTLAKWQSLVTAALQESEGDQATIVPTDGGGVAVIG